MRNHPFPSFLSQLRPKSFSRKPSHKPPQLSPRFHQARPITTKENQPVLPDDIYNYTSGRWLASDEAQRKQRFVKFNIDNLCSLGAAQFGNATKCIHLDKIEANSNKALVLTMDDGSEVIAKIPCPNAGPASYMTSSEVATLMFLKRCTSIPVPEVYTWSSRKENPVGAEYIIMEKATGVPLFKKWNEMTRSDRTRVVDQIAEMEKELEGLEFPAYGNLFLAGIPGGLKSYPLSPGLDPEGLFCVGPACSRIWRNEDLSKVKVDIGPWPTFFDFAMSLPQAELAWIADSPEAIQKRLHQFDKEQTVDEYETFIERISTVLPILCAHPPVSETSKPVLWHTDMNLGNIFVSPENPTKITSIIDWQSSQIRPLFMQARFPEFLIPPKGYQPGLPMPALPENFNDLSTVDQELATKTKIKALLSKYYEFYTKKHNKRIYNALSFDRKLWEPFTYCQLFSHGSLFPSYKCLSRLEDSWSLLDLPGDCPYSLTEKELQKHFGNAEKYQAQRELREIVQDTLCTDESGWVPNENWEGANEVNKELYEAWIKAALADEDITVEEAKRYWPFPPRE